MYHNNFFVHRDGFGRLDSTESSPDSAGYLFENQSVDNRHRHLASIGSSTRAATGVVPADGGCFGFIVSGAAQVTGIFNRSSEVRAGQFFTTAGDRDLHVTLLFAGSRVVVFQCFNYVGMATVGQVEAEGRLGYIDGCKDTVLHGPLVKGLPCLNALFMPVNINQTQHTHPSTRLGVIMGGGGCCVTPTDTHALLPGDVFHLPANGYHRFLTGSEVGMSILAFHPDSDFGPTNEEHPMLNRTEVDGVSAKHLPEIQTRTSLDGAPRIVKALDIHSVSITPTGHGIAGRITSADA
jgi:hypothetical protein